MKKYPGIPELVETYRQETACDERWFSVQELRDRFGLTRYQSNTVSAFLRRLNFRPFGRYPFIVTRMVREEGEKPSDPKKYRYLLKTRQAVSPPVTPGLPDPGGLLPWYEGIHFWLRKDGL